MPPSNPAVQPTITIHSGGKGSKDLNVKRFSMPKL